jgi:hypothetical protein
MNETGSNNVALGIDGVAEAQSLPGIMTALGAN